MSSRRRRSFIVFFAVAVALGTYFISNPGKKKKIKGAGKDYSVPFKKEGSLAFLTQEGDTIRTIDIEIAESSEEQTQGLMYRGSMSDDQGMLFIFPREEPRSFWMKNTYISLDIIFAAANGDIVSISKNTIPYSESQVLSDGKALYVIEVVAGFSDQYGITPDSKFIFERQ